MAQTPLLTTSIDGLLQNDSLSLNTELKKELDIYRAWPIQNDVKTIFESKTVLGLEWGPITEELKKIPGVTGYRDYSGEIYTKFVDNIENWCNDVIGTDYGGNKKFTTTCLSSMGTMDVSNNLIDNSISLMDVASNTFTTMDDLSSGNVNAVSTSPSEFGSDLESTGGLINLAEIHIFGTPEALMIALIRTNAITMLIDQLSIYDIALDIQSDDLSNLHIQKKIYQMAENVDGKLLDDILLIMNIKTENLTVLADLLDLTKIFPNSYDTLRVNNNNNFEFIYSGSGAGSYASKLTPNSISVMPMLNAKTNTAFIHMMMNLKSITQSTVPELVDLLVNTESIAELNDINSLTKPLDPATVENIINEVGKGTDDNNKFFLTDFVGSPTGFIHTNTLQTFNVYMLTFNAEELTEIVNKIAGGDSSELGNLIKSVNTILNDSEYKPLPPAYDESLNHIELEKQNLASAEVDLYQEVDSNLGVIGFGEALHFMGTRTDTNDVVEVIENLSQDNMSGQAVIAGMTEGRNLKKLDMAGIKTDIRI